MAFLLCFNKLSRHAPLHSTTLLFLSAPRMIFLGGVRGGRAGREREGESSAVTTCSPKSAACNRAGNSSGPSWCALICSSCIQSCCADVLLIICFFWPLIFIPITTPLFHLCSACVPPIGRPQSKELFTARDNFPRFLQ